jgi:hypothetical protein
VPRVDSKAPRRAAALLVASAAVLLSAACGGGTDNSGGGSGGGNASGGGGNAAFTAYVDCMNKNGVPMTIPSGGPRIRPSDGTFPSRMPRPSGSAGTRGGFPGGGFPGGGFFAKPAGVDDATWQKAQSACASLRPSGRPGGRNGGDGRNSAYFNCLREHGVTMTGGQPPSADPALQKALETCKVLQPQASATPSA